MATKIVILGAGESGVGAAILAQRKGFQVFVSDKGLINKKYKNVLLNHDIEFEEGKHSLKRILEAEEVVKSPGIPDTVDVVKQCLTLKIPVISEIEFASRFTNAFKICITGSNGKTTTASLIHHIMKSAGYNVSLAGNIGKSFAWQVAENNFEVYVLEISSFQLDGMFDFVADIAILTNITPDHLDRYENQFQNYVNSKFRIIRNQNLSNYFIYCSDDKVIAKEVALRSFKAKGLPYSLYSKFNEGAYLENNNIVIHINNSQFTMTINELALQGKHNIYNSMAAAMATRVLDVSKDYLKQSLSDFQNVEHRLEYVGNVHGIEFVNDSKATNINSVWYALECMQKPVIWIVGGKDKGNNYEELAELVSQKVKAIVCLGVDNTRIIEAFSNIVDTIIDTHNIDDAVKSAYYLGHPGDVVLLSPACASFDLFENYMERGDQFKLKVSEL